MSFACVQMEIRDIKIAIDTLSKSFPLSNIITVVADKNFKNIIQKEAYEVLRYLLNACGKAQFKNCLDENLWKKCDRESKLVLEKFKKDILDEIKSISKEKKVHFPILKKSDLLVPYRPLLFMCCAGLASYALNFQLGLMGVEFWPKSFQQAKNSFEHHKEELKSLQKKSEETKKELEKIKHEFNLYEEIKREALSSIVQTLTECPPSTDVGILQCSREDRLARIEYMRNQADELHRKNLEKLTRMNKIYQSLKSLTQMSESTERVVIDGKDLAALIPYETEAFARREGIPYYENGTFSIQRLLQVVIRSFEQPRSIIRYNASDLLKSLEQIKPDDSGPEVLKTLTEIRDRLEPQVTSAWANLRANSDKEADNKWIDNYFVKIPALEFVPNPPVYRKPFIDLEKLDRMIEKRMRQDIISEEQDSGPSLAGSSFHTKYSRSGRGMFMSLNKNQSSSSVRSHSELSNSTATDNKLQSCFLRSDDLPSCSSRSDDLPSCSTRSDDLPSCSTISDDLPSCSTRSDDLPSCSPRSDDGEEDSFNMSNISGLYFNRVSLASLSPNEKNTTKDTFDDTMGSFPSLEDLDLI